MLLWVGRGISGVLSLGSGRYHPKSVPSEVELKLSRCAVRPKYGGCKNAELYFLDSDTLRELSWFFWIVVFLSVWVIYTTSA